MFLRRKKSPFCKARSTSEKEEEDDDDDDDDEEEEEEEEEECLRTKRRGRGQHDEKEMGQIRVRRKSFATRGRREETESV